MSSKMDAALEDFTKNFPLRPEERQIVRTVFIEGYARGAEWATDLALLRPTPSEGGE